MDELLKEFSIKYEYLYNADVAGVRVPGYNLAVEYGDELIREHHPVVAEFVKARQDPLTSDREVAAFAFAAVALGYA